MKALKDDLAGYIELQAKLRAVAELTVTVLGHLEAERLASGRPSLTQEIRRGLDQQDPTTTMLEGSELIIRERANELMHALLTLAHVNGPRIASWFQAGSGSDA
jgi:hypothetical protein